VLERLAPDIADEAEYQRLLAAERRASAATRLNLRKRGGGSPTSAPASRPFRRRAPRLPQRVHRPRAATTSTTRASRRRTQFANLPLQTAQIDAGE
jgi:hypothetical protein